MVYNEKADRTFRISGSFAIDGMVAQFVQGVDISLNAAVFQRDSIGTGQSVFTQNSDIVGGFSFSLKNTTSLYDPADTPTLDSTISKWMNAIASQDPLIVTFIQTLNAPKGAGIKVARIQFDGRIMKADTVMSVDNAIEDVNIEGEITNYVKAQRKI